MARATKKKMIVPGVSIWPQPKKNPRMRYRLTYGPKDDRTTITASTDLETTVEMAFELSKRRERKRVGLLKPDEERYGEQGLRHIKEHLDEYRLHLEAAGCGPRHVSQMHQYANLILLGGGVPRSGRKTKATDKPVTLEGALILAGTGAERIGDVMASTVEREVGKVKAKRSAATANRYRDAVNAFLEWGVTDRRWEKNPISHLGKFSTEADRRRERRAIPLEQVAKLIEATAKGPIVEGVSGLERSLIYRACISTGLRAKESRRMQVQDLVLKGQIVGIWSSARTAKNKQQRRSLQTISGALAERLLEHVKGKLSTDAVFKVPHNTARMLRADLERAGIPYKLEGRVFDFHALRHQSGAFLVAAGLDVKTVQKHMRHSTAALTLDTYGHVLEESEARAAAAMPDFDEKAQHPAQRETGFDVRRRSLMFGEGGGMNAAGGGKTDWSRGESNPDLLNAINQTGGRRVRGGNKLRQAGSREVAQVIAPGRYFRFRGRVLMRMPRPISTCGIDATRRQVRRLLAKSGKAVARG
jgi:integrase